MGFIQTRKTTSTCCQSSKQGDFAPCSSRNRTWTSRFIRLFKMPRPISKLALTNCLDKQVNHSFRLFCVHQFLHLVYPFATAYFHKLSTLLRVHPPLYWFVKVYYLLRVLRLMILPLCRLHVLASLQTTLPTWAYSTCTGSPVLPMRLSVSPGGFIPDAANTSGNF